MEIAERAEPGSVILCMLPDTGERYLSSPLFETIEEDMTEEEIALSLATPGFHMPDQTTRVVLPAAPVTARYPRSTPRVVRVELLCWCRHALIQLEATKQADA